MPHITDPRIARAVRELYKASTARRQQLDEMVRLHDLDHVVISALHDLVIEAEQRDGKLRIVSGGAA
jgi:hypothetical protein